MEFLAFDEKSLLRFVNPSNVTRRRPLIRCAEGTSEGPLPTPTIPPTTQQLTWPREQKNAPLPGQGEWLLFLVACLLSSAVSNPVTQTYRAGVDTDITVPCPGEPIQDSEPCIPNMCDQYSTLINLLIDDIKSLRGSSSESTGLAEVDCLNMSIANGSLITLTEGDLQCSKRNESDALAHKAVVVHQAYAIVLSHSDSSFPSFEKVKSSLKMISCALICHCRSLNTTELSDYAHTVKINSPSEASHKYQLGCIVLRSLVQTLQVINAYLTSCT